MKRNRKKHCKKKITNRPNRLKTSGKDLPFSKKLVPKGPRLCKGGLSALAAAPEKRHSGLAHVS